MQTAIPTACTPWQSKKKLRAEIYYSFIKMAKAGLPVDPEMYPLVRERLRSQALCGSYALEAPAEMPQPPPKPAKPANYCYFSNSIICLQSNFVPVNYAT